MQPTFTLQQEWTKRFLCGCVWLLLSACGQAPDSSFTEQLWQLRASQAADLEMGDVLIFKGDSVHIRNKFTGKRQQLPWRAAPFADLADSLTYVVPSFESKLTKRLTVALYRGDSLLAKLDSVVPALAGDTLSHHCLASDATYAVAMGEQHLHVVTVTPPGEAAIRHILASDTASELRTQNAMNYSMAPMLRIDEAGIFTIRFFKQDGPEGTTMLLDYFCQCEQDDGQGNLKMACLSQPLFQGIPAKVDTFYFQKLPPLIPLEVGEGSILERINTGRLVITEDIGSITAEEASYDDEESFLARKGLYYQEVQDLQLDMAPNGLFTLFTSQKVIREEHWQLSKDRRHIFLYSPDRERVSRIAITAYEEDHIELVLSGLRVATPKNFGEQLMSYVLASVRCRVYVD